MVYNFMKEQVYINKKYSHKTLIFGFGINDLNYPVRNKKGKMCPYYSKWRQMIQRVFDKNFHRNRPTYLGCSICNDWIYASNFKIWMKNQDWKGKQLDKDIINIGNKIYSPENCCFVFQNINTIFMKKKKRDLPEGVFKNLSGYFSKISENGVIHRFGTFLTIKEARNAYIQKKCDILLSIAKEEKDKRIHNGIINHIKSYKDELL